MTQISSSPESRRVARVARCFAAGGRLVRWPARRADQLLALWVPWSFLPPDRQMSEPEVNSMLRDWHDFEDYALLRREMVDRDLLRRTPDGAIYRRIEHPLPEEAQRLMTALELD